MASASIGDEPFNDSFGDAIRAEMAISHAESSTGIVNI